MIKWFLYIVLLMIFVPRLSSAKIFNGDSHTFPHTFSVLNLLQHDTTTVTKGGKHPSEEDKKKIKEVAKAKKMPKPEKVEDTAGDAAKQKPKPKRQRRPEGLERPPEIPRRNN
jgi:hypothetical protein